MTNVIFSVFSRVVVILSQVLIILLMIRMYGELTAGYFSYASAIASVLFMCCTFTLTKLVAVRYKSRSVTYFFSIFLVGSLFSLAIYILSYFFFIKEEAILVLITFLIKFLDYSNEFFMVYYRRLGKELLLFKKQTLRLVIIIILFFIVKENEINANIALAVLAVFYFVLFLYDCYFFGPKFKVVFSIKPFLFYLKMIQSSWKNSLNGLLSTFSTNSPKFACAYFLSMESVAIYTVLSYVYTVFCTFVSIFIQVFVIKIKDYNDSWSKFEIKSVFFILMSVFLVSTVNYLFGYDIFVLATTLNVSEVSYITITSLLLLTTIPLSIRDLESYLFIKRGFIMYINSSTVISLASFWMAISSLNLLSLSELCFYLLAANFFGMAIIIICRIFKVRVT